MNAVIKPGVLCGMEMVCLLLAKVGERHTRALGSNWP